LGAQLMLLNIEESVTRASDYRNWLYEVYEKFYVTVLYKY